MSWRGMVQAIRDRTDAEDSVDDARIEAEVDAGLAHCGEAECRFGGICQCQCHQCWLAGGGKAGRHMGRRNQEER